MRKALVAVVVVGMSACEGTIVAQARTVSVRPTEASFTLGSFELATARHFKVRLWSDSTFIVAPTIDREGAQVFEVPAGPALFEFAPRRFVYTSRERLEPCDSTMGGAGRAEIEFDVELAQPAIEGDSLQLVGTALPWLSHTLELVPGSTALVDRVDWSGRFSLAGSVSAVHRVKAPPAGDFERFTSAGVLDASEGAVRGHFRKVSSAGELEIAWDAASLEPLRRTGAVVATTELAARQRGLPIASVTTGSDSATTASMLLPALEADSFAVKGLIAVVIDDEHTYLTPFGWQLGLNSRELKLPHEPPGLPTLSRAEAKLSWPAPAIAPDVYIAKVMRPLAPFVFEVLGEIVTDQLTVPLPWPLRGPNTFVVLTALRGEGISAATCAYHVERLPSWERLPVVGPLTE